MRSLAAAGSSSSGSGNGTFLLLGVVLLLGALLFVSNRRKRRQSQERQESLQIGSAVSTTSGMLGTLVRMDDQTATVQVSPGVELEFIRRAIVPRSALLPDSPTDGEPTTNDGALSLEKESAVGWDPDDAGAAREVRGDNDNPRAEA